MQETASSMVRLEATSCCSGEWAEQRVDLTQKQSSPGRYKEPLGGKESILDSA